MGLGCLVYGCGCIEAGTVEGWQRGYAMRGMRWKRNKREVRRERWEDVNHSLYSGKWKLRDGPGVLLSQ